MFTNQTKQTQQPIISKAEKQFLHTYTAGAMLPLTQATITATLIFIGTFVISYFVFDMVDPIKPAVIFAVIAWITTWFSRQKQWLSLTSIERITGIDFNNDGVIGEEETKEPTIIRIDDVTSNGHYQSNTYKLSASEEQLTTLANGLINMGRPFSRREWTTRTRLFSDSEFRALQSEMIKYGLIEPASDKSSNGGFVLSRSGHAMMKHYAPPSPTQDVEVVEKK